MYRWGVYHGCREWQHVSDAHVESEVILGVEIHEIVNRIHDGHPRYEDAHAEERLVTIRQGRKEESQKNKKDDTYGIKKRELYHNGVCKVIAIGRSIATN